MDHHRPAEPAGHVELAAEHRGLHLGRREIAEEVEPHLAQRHHLRGAAREALHRLEVGLGGLGRVVRMDADRRVDGAQALGQRHRGRIRLPVGADGDHRGDAGGARPLEHAVEVGEQLGKVHVGVGIDQGHAHGLGGFTASALTFMIRGPSISTMVQR